MDSKGAEAGENGFPILKVGGVLCVLRKIQDHDPIAQKFTLSDHAVIDLDRIHRSHRHFFGLTERG